MEDGSTTAQGGSPRTRIEDGGEDIGGDAALVAAFWGSRKGVERRYGGIGEGMPAELVQGGGGRHAWVPVPALRGIDAAEREGQETDRFARRRG